MSTATWAHRDTVVSKLTLRGKKLDSLVAPQRLTHLLQTVDLYPPGFPPDAILCIRRCRTRIPASWATRPHAVLPSLEWQRTLQGSIDQLRHRAMRPLYEAVPPSAEAVLFANRAELLACVARDWCDETLPTRWWWQSLFPQQGGYAAFLRAWQESGEHIPSTLQVLARLGLLVPVMNRLPEHEVRMLSRLLERTFGLTELASWSLGETKEPEQSTELSMPPDLSVWDRWVPELFRSRLDLDRQRFVGVGLMVHRAPSVVRSSAFAASFQRWYRTVAEDVAVRSPREGHGGLQGPEDGAHGERFATEKTVAPPLTTDHTAMIVSATPSLQDLNGASVMSSESIKGREPAEAAPEQTPIRHGKTERALRQPTGKAILPELTSSWLLPDVSTIQTERGGIFYLLNVGLALNLYGDFTMPLRPGLALPIWDFLALVGERIVGRELMEDPIWPLLGRLAGREEGQRPGATFDPPTDWRLPREWAQPFAAGPWRWAWTEGRLRVWHQADFLLIDCAMEDEPSSHDVHALLQDYRQNGELVRVDSSSLMHGPNPLDRWLAWLLPYLRARLARALAPDGTTDWPTVLINHHATLAVTDTRLDVTFSLNQHPLAIRIAGLDRDPGWVPAAGRFVAFHYQVP